MKWISRWFRRIFRLVFFSVILCALAIWFANYQVKKVSKDYLYTKVDNVPKQRIGVVLGTSKKVVSGNLNLYFKYRMDAAAKLYKARKIDYILVSGDNSVKYYNETRDMKEYLIELGVPADKIIEDFAGLRTLDTVLRAANVFDLNEFVLISQGWHLERALFIARENKISATGFAAKDVSQYYGIKTRIREYLSRVLALLDVYILKTEPKYYKEKHPVFEHEAKG